MFHLKYLLMFRYSHEIKEDETGGKCDKLGGGEVRQGF